jgi:uncharacterized repeat protein (TIGR01451 family)
MVVRVGSCAPTMLKAIFRTLFPAIIAVMACGPTSAAAQTVTAYSNTTAGAITDVNCGTAAQISRTFVVSASAIVGDVDLGVMLTHTYRSDLRITLQSPAGTTVTVMTWTGNVQSGDNLNDRFDDEAAASITTHNATVTDPQTPVPPPYSHSFQPSNPLSAFDGQNAAGTWTMVICDAVATDTGTFARADLFISTTSLTIAKTSAVISDGVNATNPKFIPGAIVQYCLVVTNAGAASTTSQTNITTTDPLPSTVTYVPGSMASGPTCATAITPEDDNAIGADEADPFGMSFSGTTVTGVAGSLGVGATMAMVFTATVN